MSQLAFQYRAVDKSGRRSKGTLQAADRNDAYRQLSASGLRPIALKAGAGRSGRRKKSSLKDLSHLTYQLSVLMQARISIVDAMRSIGEQEPNEGLKACLEDVAARIESGMSVTDALLPHREVFGDVYIQTVRAAELSGNMIEVLEKLAEMLDRRYEMNKAVKGAMMYPICVIGALLLAMAFLLIFVVPNFTVMFESRGMELPVPTQMLIAFSDFLRSFWYVVIGGAGAGIWWIRKAWRDPRSRARIDGHLHKVPYLRDMLKGFAMSRFSHVFGLTLRSGLGLIEALEISGQASGRPMLLQDTEKMQDQVKQGGRLSDVMLTCEYLPGFAKRLFTAGEEAADLSRMCDIVAKHYDREVKYLSKNLTTVMEPVMIVGLAGIVLVIALAIFLPMWEMGSLIG